MSDPLPAIVHDGKIELLQPVDLPEGTRVLVSIVSNDDAVGWLEASQRSLAAIWDHPDDDIYGELL